MPSETESPAAPVRPRRLSRRVWMVFSLLPGLIAPFLSYAWSAVMTHGSFGFLRGNLALIGLPLGFALGCSVWIVVCQEKLTSSRSPDAVTSTIGGLLGETVFLAISNILLGSFLYSLVWMAQSR